jgi:MFS family permease
MAFFSKSSVLRNQTLLAVSFTVFAAYTGIGMVGPVRVLYAQAHGASLAVIGAMASSYLISNFLFQYPVGWLADRWGRRPLMIASLLAQAGLTVVYLFITDPIAFVVLRFLEGIAAAALIPSARAMITDTVPAEQQGEAYGLFSSFLNGGFLLGPGIGGVLALTSYSAAFIGAIVFRLLAVVIVITMIRRHQHSSVVEKRSRQQVAVSFKRLFTLPLIGAYIITFGDYLYVGFDQSLMPLWMHDHLKAAVVIIGVAYMVFAVPNMILSPVGGQLADRRRRSWLILVFGLVQVPLYIVYGLLDLVWPVIVLFGVHGVFYALMQPAVDATVAAFSASNARGRVQGLYSAFGLFGAFVGSIGFGPLYDLNFRYPLFAMGGGLGLCVLVGGLIIRIAELRNLRVDSVARKSKV